MLLNSSDVFAGFTIERLLGEGGMGAVYLARHPRLGKQTALKLLKPELFADAAIRARFEREADLAAHLEHPSIVAVYDRGVEDVHLWMCMQYVDGADAGTVNPFTLPPDKAVQIIDGVADALDYAHGKGVLHRDVKPSNILLARARPGQGERVFLTDFGLARLRAETVRLTQTGMFTATLAFASPEQMTGGDMDGRSDQYSLACTLYWLLTGRAPFDSPNPADIIHGNLQLAAPPLAVKRRGLPPQLDAVLAKAMAKNPAHRYRTCLEFAAAAGQVVTGSAPAAAPSDRNLRAEAEPARAGQPGVVGEPLKLDPSGLEPTVSMASPERPPAATAPGGVEHTGAIPVPSAQAGPDTTAGPPGGQGYAAGPRMPVGGAGNQQGGYPHTPGGHGGYAAAAPPVGYAPPPHRRRAPWIAAAILVPLIVAALIVTGVLVRQGMRDSGVDDASAVAATSTSRGATLEREQPGTAPARPSADDDRTRHLFPTLLPPGDAREGYGYQNARCRRYTSDEGVPAPSTAPPFADVLENRPWEAVWDCRRTDLDPALLDYSLITYPDEDAVEEIVEALPPHEQVPGVKDDEPYIAYFWAVAEADGSSRFDVDMLVVFGSEVDSPRSNSVLFARQWGTSARQDLEQWWSTAPL